MSRHTIPAKDDGHEVVVGWDQPLLTFFAIVYDKSKRGTDDDIVLWKGTRPREIYEVEDLRRVLGKYAKLGSEMRSTLYGDKDEGR
jgi:hypothetical protein